MGPAQVSSLARISHTDSEGRRCRDIAGLVVLLTKTSGDGEAGARDGQKALSGLTLLPKPRGGGSSVAGLKATPANGTRRVLQGVTQ